MAYLAGGDVSIIDLACDLSCRNRDKVTPLMMAASSGFLDAVELLLQQPGIDLEAQAGPLSLGALHLACR